MDEFIGHLSEVAAPQADQATTEIQVFKTGKFRKGGRTFEIGAKQFAEAIKNFNDKVAGDLPLDYDHEFSYGGSSQAAGWFQRLYEKDGALWATVELTKDAAEKVRAGVYRFFSPEFHGNYPDETGKKHGFTILAGGLTNRPFLKNMAPVTMDARIAAEFEDQVRSIVENVFSDIAAERGGDMGILGKTSEGEQTVETLTARVAELEPLAAQVETLSSERDAAVAERDALQTKAADAETGKSAAETKVEALSERLETVEKQAFTDKLSECLTRHRKRGAIKATDEVTDKWTKRAEKHGVGFIDDLLTDIPDEAAVAMSEVGHGEDAPITATAPKVTSPDGTVYEQDPEQFQLHERAEKLAAEKGISYEAAVDRCVAEGATS